MTPPSAGSWCSGLREEHHVVDLAEDGDARRGSSARSPRDYDAILLDVMLPAQDGFTLCRRHARARASTRRS